MRKRMIAIGFGHKKRMGKDTAARIMVDLLRQKYPHKRIATAHFADKLKQIAYDLYKWAGVKPAGHYETHPEDRNKPIEPLGITVRDLWIKIGTPMFRESVYDGTWVEYVRHTYHTYDFVIIPDLRFLNEMAMIDISIKIHRDSVPISNDVADCALDGFNQWTHTLHNLDLEETTLRLAAITEGL